MARLGLVGFVAVARMRRRLRGGGFSSEVIITVIVFEAAGIAFGALSLRAEVHAVLRDGRQLAESIYLKLHTWQSINSPALLCHKSSSCSSLSSVYIY
jgi:hypothetical protein